MVIATKARVTQAKDDELNYAQEWEYWTMGGRMLRQVPLGIFDVSIYY